MDLDGDGRTDVISGSWPGEIYFFRRQPDGKFAAGVQLKGRDGKPLNVGSAAAAFAADWGGDGALDLVVGTVLGEVWLIPNEGKGKGLAFGTPRRLEAAGQPIKVGGDAAPVVADWDGDGRPDLLLGDRCGSFHAKPHQTEREKAEERKANDRLPELRQRWADAFRRYRQAEGAADQGALRAELQRLKDEIAAVQEIQSHYQPGYQSHGFVWVFLRRPPDKKAR